MTKESSLVFSGIAPHPPIMVPEVGQEAIARVQDSILAMAELTKRVIASGAETVVLISPHAPIRADSFVSYPGPELYGDFSKFRAPDARLCVPLDEELLTAITQTAASENYDVVNLLKGNLDHGTAVPLYFFLQNGWKGRVVCLGYSFLSDDDHLRFGTCIRKAIDKVGRPVALIASGDLSHRLKPEAPAGYHPSAYLFDEQVVDALRLNESNRIIDIDPDLRELAGECGYRSILIALGAGGELRQVCAVLNYEAPFGVGYLVAQLTNQGPDGLIDDAGWEQKERAKITATARLAVETFVTQNIQMKAPAEISGLLAARAPCFVSLKTMMGDLRGCIGTIEPEKDTLAEEIIANAVSAATRDPRFPPVSIVELPNLRYSVDVLTAAEPAEMGDLDPKIYGVIVEDEESSRRGLLLPDISGVESVEQQVEIAARKAGISAEAPLKLSRFRVERFRE